MELMLGLLLQILGCGFAAAGLAFMKLSSEHDSGRLMILRWRWWLGFLCLGVFATVVEGIVLTLVPLTIVAPFAGLTILISILLAASGCISAQVPVGRAEALGGALTVVGVGLVSLFGPTSESAEASLTFPAVLAALADPHFVLFIAITLVSVVGWLAIVLAPLSPAGSTEHGGKARQESWRSRVRTLTEEANVATALSAYAAAVCGALSQTFLKCVSVAVGRSLALPTLSMALRDVWLRPPMWAAISGLAVCAPLQLYLLDVCLASAAVTYAVPLYQALLVSLEIVAAALFFRELESEEPGRLVGFGLGVAVATAGLVVLSRPPREEKASESAAPEPYHALV